MTIDPVNFVYRNEIHGSIEGLTTIVRPTVSGLYTNLAFEFPDHWNSSVIEVRGDLALEICLSTDGVLVNTHIIPAGESALFFSHGKRQLFLRALSGNPRAYISIVSAAKGGYDTRQFSARFGAQPQVYLHADMWDTALGAPPDVRGGVGSRANLSQSPLSPPLLTAGWGAQGKKCLDFAGNKGVRLDSLAGFMPTTQGPMTIIMALVIPSAATTKVLFDFRSTSFPTSRYFEFYIGPTDVFTLYAQSSFGLVTQNALMLPPGSEDVPLILGITKHAATWDLCVLSAGGAADLAAGDSHTAFGSSSFDLCTIGCEFDGTTPATFSNIKLRALGAWFVDIPIAQLRSGLKYFAENLDCPLT